MKPIQWKVCGHEISNKARLALLASTMLSLGVLTSACDGQSQSASTAPSASREPITAVPAEDCSTQAEREAFIEKLIAQGHWQKVGRLGRLFHVNVTPAFLAETSPDEKQRSLAVVSAYSQCTGGESRVVINDAKTGEQIGEFSDAGLRLKNNLGPGL